jgi:peptidoglycan/LPS O-acetylase OafA/YrhL
VARGAGQGLDTGLNGNRALGRGVEAPAMRKKAIGFAPLTYMGRISYSMYLYHLPLLLLFNKYAPAALAGLAFPCYFAAVAAASTASFHFVEWPFMRGTKRMTFKPASLSPAP